MDAIYDIICASAAAGATFHARDVLAKVTTGAVWKREYHRGLRALAAAGLIEFTGEVCIWRRLK